MSLSPAPSLTTYSGLLSPEFATKVRDLLLRPPEEDPYNKLKTELTKHTSASEQRRLQELLSAEELGDRTPSQVLQHIQQLLGNYSAQRTFSSTPSSQRSHGPHPFR